MKKLLKGLGIIVATVTLAAGIYAAAWFMTLTRHNIDQCYTMLKKGDDRDHFRSYYGCQEAAKEGMKHNNATAFSFAGIYSGVLDDDLTKAREYLYKAIRLGRNHSKIDLYIVLDYKSPAYCREQASLLLSYKPEDEYWKDYKDSEILDLKDQGCI